MSLSPQPKMKMGFRQEPDDGTLSLSDMFARSSNTTELESKTESKLLLTPFQQYRSSMLTSGVDTPEPPSSGQLMSPMGTDLSPFSSPFQPLPVPRVQIQSHLDTALTAIDLLHVKNKLKSLTITDGGPKCSEADSSFGLLEELPDLNLSCTDSDTKSPNVFSSLASFEIPPHVDTARSPISFGHAESKSEQDLVKEVSSVSDVQREIEQDLTKEISSNSMDHQVVEQDLDDGSELEQNLPKEVSSISQDHGEMEQDFIKEGHRESTIISSDSDQRKVEQDLRTKVNTVPQNPQIQDEEQNLPIEDSPISSVQGLCSSSETPSKMSKKSTSSKVRSNLPVLVSRTSKLPTSRERNDSAGVLKDCSRTSTDLKPLSAAQRVAAARAEHQKESEETSSQVQETEAEESRVKRKRIVFDSPVKPNIINQLSESKQNSSPQTSTLPEPQMSEDDSSNEEAFSSDDSMVLDEEERQQFQKIKSKYKSPKRKRPKIKAKVPSPTQPSEPSLSEPVDAEGEVRPEGDAAPPGDIQSLHQKEIDEVPTIVKSGSKSIINPADFGSKYRNYEGCERAKYQREITKRSQTISPGCSPIESDFSRCSRLENPQPAVQVDRTPEYGTPEIDFYSDEDCIYASDSRQNSSTSFYTETGNNSFENNSVDSSLDGVQSDEDDLSPREEIVMDEETFYVDDYVGCDLDCPPTPVLVRELEEEEECLEQTAVVEDILKETSIARDFVCSAVDAEDEKDNQKEVQEEEERVTWSSCKQVVVLDTVALIASLSTVTCLLEREDVEVVVPWQVLQEVERLKLSDRKIGLRARAAGRWLGSVLLSPQSNVRAETFGQSKKVRASYESRAGEDRILATCLSLVEHGQTVILVTEDVNLSRKAIINGVKSGKSKEVFDILEGKLGNDLLSASRENDFNELRILLDNSLKQARDITRDILESVIRKEFKDWFKGEKLLDNLYSIKPRPKRPHWTLKELFQLYSNHHLAVLSQAFPENGSELRAKMQILKDFLLRRECWRIQDVKDVFTAVLNLLETFQKKDDYEGVVTLCTEKVQENIDQLTEEEELKAKSKKKILDFTLDDSTQEKVQDLLTANWEIILAFSWGFAEALNVSTSKLNPLVKKIKFPTRAVAAEELPDFFSSVNELYQAMRKMVDNPENDGTGFSVVDTRLTGDFFVQLIGFRNGLELDQSQWPLMEDSLKRQELQWFVRRPQNEEMIRSGLQQLTGYRETLKRCIEATVS